MASYQMFVVCVVVCTVHSGHSYSVSGTILHYTGVLREVKLSNYVSGEDWINTGVVTLDRLEGADTLPALTIVNFRSIGTLNLTNIALERVPVFVNTSCTAIYIVGNKIKSVPARAFSGAGPLILDLSKNEIQNMANRSVNVGARYVYLQCNQLSHFSESWFEDPGNIQVLILRSNRIEYIEDRAFSQMAKLYWLDLSYNRITSIGSEAFGGGITNLALHFNEIAQLTADMFAHRNISMSGLHLHHNQLGYLPEALLLKVKPQQITLFGNPWQCQCLRDLERWLRELNIVVNDIAFSRGDPVCVVPLSDQNVCVPAVDKESQQTYARALSPWQGCMATPCQCKSVDMYLPELT